MLRYEKGNNFYKFRAVFPDIANEKYGNLGKPIDLEEYYLPQLIFSDFVG